jgi:hypothetical protein
MKWTALFLAAMFLCLANAVMAEETQASKFDLRIYNLEGSSSNSYWKSSSDGRETLTDDVKRNAGFKVSGVIRLDDFVKPWGWPFHYQARLSYQRFSATAQMWTASGFGETGWNDVKYYNHKMTLDSVALQAFMGADIIKVKDVSLRIFIPVSPSLAIERCNSQYGLAGFVSTFLELKMGKAFLEAGYGWKISYSGFGKFNQTDDTDKYVGFGYQIW